MGHIFWLQNFACFPPISVIVAAIAGLRFR